MHSVAFTSTFLRQVERAGLSDDELMEILVTIAAEPLGGVLMPGTGGARKIRHAGKSEGKSGGYRTNHYFGGEDIPVFMLALVDKGERSDLSQAEKNALAKTLPLIVESYRTGRRILQ